MRFTGLDTAQLLRDPGQQMGYGYVSGSPLAQIDPTGMFSFVLSTGVEGSAGSGSLQIGSGIYIVISDDNWDAGIINYYGGSVSEGSETGADIGAGLQYSPDNDSTDDLNGPAPYGGVEVNTPYFDVSVTLSQVGDNITYGGQIQGGYSMPNGFPVTPTAGVIVSDTQSVKEPLGYFEKLAYEWAMFITKYCATR